MPRLHFLGEFIAEPSTINNRPDNMAGPIVDPGWNPNGTHKLAFSNCRVTALASDGQLTTTGDSLIGAPVTTPGAPFAKIVDLDVEVQMASKVYGLVVAIADSGGNSVRGAMASASFRDFSAARILGIYQSMLNALEWHVAPLSWLAKLRAASPDVLSIRFITDLFTGLSGGAHRGRLAGAIGPATAQEPAHYVAGRRIVGVQGPSASAEATGDRLTVDVGNIVSLQANQSVHSSLTIAVKGSPAQHDLALKTGAVVFAASMLPAGWRQLGTMATTVERYGLTSGVESIQLSQRDATTVASSPLGVFTSNGSPLALEAADGLFVFPDRAAFAMNPGEQTSVLLTASRFGRPAAGLVIPIVQTKSAGAAGIAFPQTVTTDGDGRAAAVFAASDPGWPRDPLDGQVFGFGGAWADAGDVLIRDAQSAVAILVFSQFTPPAQPKWDDVRAIFEAYAKLYPGMTEILDLRRQSGRASLSLHRRVPQGRRRQHLRRVAHRASR